MSAATNSYASYSYQNQKTFQTVPINYCQESSEVTVLANSAWAHPYQSGVIVPKMEHNYKANVTPAQTPHSPRFLFGNAANFQKFNDNVYERPLLMDAWAQTTIEDFGLISDEHRDRIDYLQKENELLRERVHALENELRVHSDLLNQINQVSNQAAAALKTKTHENMEHISPTPPATPVMNQHVQNYQNLQRISPNATYTTTLHTPQVMNSLRANAGANAATTDSVKYTIVSQTREKHENQNIEPIEIHLAEEDGALNLNGSADSGRLEICLGNEQEHANQTQETANFNNEIINEDNNSLPPLPAQSGILIKRRKLNSDEQEESSTYTAYQQDQTSVRLHDQSRRLTAKQISAEQSTTPNTLRHLQDENVMVSIGPNNTRVPYKLYESINWDNPSIATRKLLMAIFDRNTLATHSMTGKPSPAFKGQAKPQKQRLDPRVTEDIVFVVTRRCKVSDKEVRNAITTKCADENKMMKLQLNKKNSSQRINNNNSTNKENQHYIAQQQMH